MSFIYMCTRTLYGKTMSSVHYYNNNMVVCDVHEDYEWSWASGLLRRRSRAATEGNNNLIPCRRGQVKFLGPVFGNTNRYNIYTHIIRV